MDLQLPTKNPRKRSSPAAMEEFQEADVLWPDKHRDGHGQHQQQRRGSSRQPHAVDAGRPGSSAPVGIPVVGPTSTTGPASWARRYCSDYGGDGPASASFVPPHEIAARRRCSEEERAASSVCVGNGRTLKGRDLRSVRTAVLRMTGFLES